MEIEDLLKANDIKIKHLHDLTTEISEKVICLVKSYNLSTPEMAEASAQFLESCYDAIVLRLENLTRIN